MKEKITLLGKTTEYPTTPDKKTLEWFENKYQKNSYSVEHSTEEITSLCRKTGQPDFGTITIWYVPNKKLIESKSLKLYLQSYRYERTFMEPMVNRIANDIYDVIEPEALTVEGKFNARGGVTLKCEVYKGVKK